MPRVSEAHLEQRRQQILDAAIACFALKGFHQTTMADIATQAGVSDTLAYRYFSSKDEIIDAAIRQYGDTTTEEVWPAPESLNDVVTLADWLLASSGRRFDDRAAASSTMGLYFQSWAAAINDEHIRGEVVGRWRDHFDVAEGLVRRGQDAGQVSPDIAPRAVAWVMLGLHYGLSLLATLDPEVDFDECREVALSMVRGLMVGPSVHDGAPRAEGAENR